MRMQAGKPALRRNERLVPLRALIGAVCAICMICGCFSPSQAYTGRRAVLYTEAQVLLAENAPWVRGKTDCSGQLWKLLKKVFPELTVTRWFHRTTAAAMATWPWPPVMSLGLVEFGDLLFANGEPGNVATWSQRKWHTISHVLMAWDTRGTAIHAGKTNGFSISDLAPYWTPRINLAIRPPY